MILDLDDDAGTLVQVDGAVVVPPLGMGRSQASGVLSADGEEIENAISWTRAGERNTTTPVMPSADAIETLTGTWMFGGVLFGHFGHFIVESLARIWAVPQLRDRIDGVVFVPKQVGGNVEGVLRAQRPLMDALGMDVPARCLIAPTRVEHLYVPRQGFGMFDLTGGSRAFRDHMNLRAARDIAPAGAPRIYISRSALPPQRGGLVGEYLLETHLAAEGYEMFHPQKHPHHAQIAQYKAARDVISVDCSPLHLLGYVGDAGQRVAVITRRSMGLTQGFVTQLKRFKGMDALAVDTLREDWVPGNSMRAGRSSFGEIDLPETWRILRERGMISGDTPWPALTDEQRAAELARIERTHEAPFRALSANRAAAQAREAARARPTSS